MQFPLVEVYWLDSALSPGWKMADSWVTYAKCRTVGYQVPSAKDVVVLSTNVNNEGGYGDAMAIPKAVVTKVKVLRKGS